MYWHQWDSQRNSVFLGEAECTQEDLSHRHSTSLPAVPRSPLTAPLGLQRSLCGARCGTVPEDTTSKWRRWTRALLCSS